MWMVDREKMLREYATVVARNYSLYLGPMERTSLGFRLFASHPSLGVVADVHLDEEDWVCDLWRLPVCPADMDTSLLALHVVSAEGDPQKTVVLSPSLHSYYRQRLSSYGRGRRLGDDEPSVELTMLDTLYAVVEQMRAEQYSDGVEASPELVFHSVSPLSDHADIVGSWGEYTIRVWLDKDEAWMHVYPLVSDEEPGKLPLWSASSPDNWDLGRTNFMNWEPRHLVQALASFLPRLRPTTVVFQFAELEPVEEEYGFIADPEGYEVRQYHEIRARSVKHARQLLQEKYPHALFNPFPSEENDESNEGIPVFQVAVKS